MVSPVSSGRGRNSSSGRKCFMFIVGLVGLICVFQMTSPQEQFDYYLLNDLFASSHEEKQQQQQEQQIMKQETYHDQQKENQTTRRETTTALATAVTDSSEIKRDIGNQVNRNDSPNNKFDDTTTSNTVNAEKSNERNNNNNKNNNNSDPLNILILYGDDWTLKTLGVLNSFVKTPNLDALAKRGLLFTHNCVTTSICMVSRATMYTGQYASRHMTLKPISGEMFKDGVWNETLFPLLKAKGNYHVGMVGKWHHPSPKHAIKGVFDTFISYQGSHYIKRGGVTRHVTEWNELDAVEFLTKRPLDKKFALLVSFFAIHAEDGSQEQYRPQNASLYKYYTGANLTVPYAKTATQQHFEALPKFLQSTRNFGRGRWMKRYRTDELYQKMMKNMYRMVTEVDNTCGKILKLLETQGVLNETLVIFTTDNGNLHGEHGMAEKWYPYEESIRVPLIIADPRMPKQYHGKRNSEFTLNIDLAPTILSASKLPVPKVMQGRDMASLYLKDDRLSYNPNWREKNRFLTWKPNRRNGNNNNNTTSSSTDIDSSKIMYMAEVGNTTWRKEFYYEWFSGEKNALPSSLALVRKNGKYIEWPEWDTEQLFRLDNDPFEEKDLFTSNLQTDLAFFNEMKTRMAQLKQLAKDGEPL